MADEKQAQSNRLMLSFVSDSLPIAQLLEQYERNAADAASTHYLLVDDGTLYKSGLALEPGKPVAVLVVAGANEPGSKQRKTLAELERFLTAWDSAPDQAMPPMPTKVKAAHQRADAGKAAPASARSRGMAPAVGEPDPGEARPRGPAYVDPGAFSGSPQQMRELAPHILNLRKGQLSDDGLASTTDFDLDLIVDQIVRNCAKGGMKLMIYAHGGLTDERFGLASAWAYKRWWLAQGIYPVFIIWETGGLETFWQIVEGSQRSRRGMARDIYDYTIDPVVETLGRGVGRLLWRAMKDSAARSSAAGGGAALFASKLAAKWRDRSALVAVGHSAGSIFHAHFLPLLTAAGITVDQLHMLAPAITLDLFETKLAGLIKGRQIGQASVFAMTREAERADNCAGVYRKSLLYLVSRAFEEKDNELILGLEDSLRAKAALVAATLGRNVILSPTGPGTPRTGASRALSHGAFDNDPATIEAVLLRINGESHAISPPFPAGDPRVTRAVSPPNYYGVPPGLFDPAPVAPVQEAPAATATAEAPARTGLGAQKIALCIGNDGFPGGMALQGCINDAKAWADTFRVQGFEPKLLLDARAGEIRDTIRGILAASRPGDSIMMHISSHGTQVLDVDGDEVRDNQYADNKDEALVAIDFDDGGLIVDDEWPGLLVAPPGVKVIRFHDFCHSGRTSRMWLGAGPNRRPRSVALPDELARKAYAAAPQPKQPAALYGADLPYMTFCACQPHESAMEESGSGIFTRAAIKVLRGQGAALSAQDAFAAIEQEMRGETQKPLLEGAALYAAAPLFGMPA